MKRAASLVAFFAIAFGLSWACWLPVAFADAGLADSWARWLTYAGSFGPAAAGIALVYRSHDPQARNEYWTRATSFSRIRRKWLIPILLLYPLATLVALLLDASLTGARPGLELAKRLLSAPWSALVFAAWVLLLGPLPEELGWRGYALDRLQRRWTPIASSLILGLAWALWHLPLFFVRGSYQHHLGFGSLSFWCYGITIVELSFLFTWIYDNNGRSTLAAILFHFVLNLTGSLAQGSPVSEAARTVVLGVVAAFVVLTWRDAKVIHPHDRTGAESGPS